MYNNNIRLIKSPVRLSLYRSEVYRQSLLINLWCFNRDAVCVVEIADDATDEVPDSTVTAIHQLIDVLERSKLVMGIILLIVIVPIVEVIAACGNLTVRLVLEFDFTLIFFGFSLDVSSFCSFSKISLLAVFICSFPFCICVNYG